ncbi:MAG: acylphosphatase [Gammaproteobacteria bacterium]|nr:acylphosphatase [Gammaproteobacteria bacterium]
MTRCIKCYVEGKVQGVFFRASTQQQALQLNLYGYATNLNDGRVEVMACGNETSLNELVHWLHTGPDHAQVDNVTCLPCETIDTQDFVTY